MTQIREKYNYLEAIKEDIREALASGDYDYKIDEVNNDMLQQDYTEDEYNESLYEALYDEMWIADSITGNASGSYTFNRWQAEGNLCHNMDLYIKACEEFGQEPKLEEAEYMDVTIRCYLLGQALGEVLEEMKEEGDF